MNQTELREALISTAREMNAGGINQGTSGNLSVRCDEGFLVTPTGLAYADMQPEDIVHMRFDGTWEGPRRPSSEWRFHRDILATRDEVNAVIHTHSTFATTLSCHGMEIPAFHYMIAMAGGNTIRCASYATFGSQALSENALQALSGRKACLLANHGLIVVGSSLQDGWARTVEVETLCEQYWRALQLGQPHILSDEEMDVVLEKFRSYGQQST